MAGFSAQEHTRLTPRFQMNSPRQMKVLGKDLFPSSFRTVDIIQFLKTGGTQVPISCWLLTGAAHGSSRSPTTPCHVAPSIFTASDGDTFSCRIVFIPQISFFGLFSRTHLIRSDPPRVSAFNWLQVNRLEILITPAKSFYFFIYCSLIFVVVCCLIFRTSHPQGHWHSMCNRGWQSWGT